MNVNDIIFAMRDMDSRLVTLQRELVKQKQQIDLLQQALDELVDGADDDDGEGTIS
jgi:hypothetical protein